MKPLSEGEENVIIYINNLGFPVLQIMEKFYTVNSFEEGSNTLSKHSLQGKDITKLMTIYVHIHALDIGKKEEIYAKIMEQKTIKKFFHKDIQWVLHLS